MLIIGVPISLLHETIDICVNELCKTNSSIHSLNKKHITEMLSLATNESIIFFDITFYTKVGDLAMGPPLGASLANAFLCHHVTKWLNECLEKFKPTFYKRYMDDIFVLLE